jgi:hypothetical protein
MGALPLFVVFSVIGVRTNHWVIVFALAGHGLFAGVAAVIAGLGMIVAARRTA